MDQIGKLLAAAAQWSKERPAAGVVAGVLELDPRRDGEELHIHVEAEGFTPLHWVALADQSLFWAIKKMRTSRNCPPDLIAACEAARAALAFEE